MVVVMCVCVCVMCLFVCLEGICSWAKKHIPSCCCVYVCKSLHTCVSKRVCLPLSIRYLYTSKNKHKMKFSQINCMNCVNTKVQWQAVETYSVGSSSLSLACCTVDDTLRRWGYHCHRRWVHRAMLSLSLGLSFGVLYFLVFFCISLSFIVVLCIQVTCTGLAEWRGSAYRSRETNLGNQLKQGEKKQHFFVHTEASYLLKVGIKQ